jgi:Lrp/AsnC family leucine-responsive transcriptional regulator
VSGAHDYLLEVVVRDLPDYEQSVRKLQAHPMVQDITSNFAIRSVKSGAPLPLKSL